MDAANAIQAQAARGEPLPAEPARARAFLPHIHLLRGIAILLVVGAHCWPEFGWSQREHDWLMLAFDNVTVVFMFISGLLFQHLSASFDYPRYLKHRASILLLPYVIVSMPAVLVVVFVSHRDGIWPWVYQLPEWQQILFFLATGKHLAPLWFIPMMMIFVVAAPGFVWIDRRDLYRWALPIALALAVALGRDSIAGVAGVLGKAAFMLPAYLAGMAFSRHREAATRWCARHGWALLGGFALTSAMMLAGVPADVSILQKLLLALLLVLLLERVPLPARVNDGLGHIARASFGIYFIHGYVISSSRLLWQAEIGAGPDIAHAGVIFPPTLIGLAADIAFVVLVTLAIIAAGRAILGKYSRYLIGA